MQIKAGFLKCPDDVMFKMGLRCTWSWRHQIFCFDKSSSCWLNDSTHQHEEKNPTSRSMLRAATELSSLKSISEDASVLRKLPSVKRKRREQFIQWELMMLDWMFKSSYITIKCEAKFLFYDKFKLNFQVFKQTFYVALEELGQDAVRSQLVKHTAQELLGYTCYIPWDQHTAGHRRENGCVRRAVTLDIYY